MHVHHFFQCGTGEIPVNAGKEACTPATLSEKHALHCKLNGPVDTAQQRIFIFLFRTNPAPSPRSGYPPVSSTPFPKWNVPSFSPSPSSSSSWCCSPPPPRPSRRTPAAGGPPLPSTISRRVGATTARSTPLFSLFPLPSCGPSDALSPPPLQVLTALLWLLASDCSPKMLQEAREGLQLRRTPNAIRAGCLSP